MVRFILLFPAILFLLLSTGFSEEAERLEKIVLQAERVRIELPDAYGSYEVVNREEIETKNLSYAEDALREVPGLSVTRSGGRGALTGLFLRGTNTEHTLFLIDGMEMNDPSSSSRGYNFAHFLLDNVERIEILKGPQSILYGSDAIGGVVNIVTKTGKGKPEIRGDFSVGSFSTFKESASISGGTEKVSYIFSLVREDSKGISSADERLGNDERDGYRNTTGFSKIRLDLSKNLSFNVLFNFIDAHKDLDWGGGRGGDDPNYYEKFRNLILKTGFDISSLDGKWDQKIFFGTNDVSRKYVNKPDARRKSWSRNTYDGTLQKIDWQNNLYLIRNHDLALGVEYERETSDFESLSSYGDSFLPKKSTNTISFYAQDRMKIGETFSMVLGVRTDHHSRFGDETTYRISPRIDIPRVRTALKASFSTGFKAPTLYQLYAPPDPFLGPIGNPNLKPEKVKSYEFGVEKRFFEDRFLLSGVYFHNDLKDLIIFDYDPVTWTYYGYKNIGKALTEGFEFSVSGAILDNFNVYLGYTLCHARDKELDEPLPRRPKQKFDASFEYSFPKKGSVVLDTQYVGPRYNSRGRVRRMGGYTVFNLSANYKINQNFTIYGRVDNLFDKHYYEVWGYGTEGRAIKGGIRLLF